MKTTTIAVNYSELCAYVASRAADLSQMTLDILGSWGITAEEAEARDWEIARIDATDIFIEDFFRNVGILDDDPWAVPPFICNGQPKNAECWEMRGY